jgi:hypothetical protein
VSPVAEDRIHEAFRLPGTSQITVASVASSRNAPNGAMVCDWWVGGEQDDRWTDNRDTDARRSLSDLG